MGNGQAEIITQNLRGGLLLKVSTGRKSKFGGKEEWKNTQMSFLINQVQGKCKKNHTGAHSLASSHRQVKTPQCKLELQRLQSTAKIKLSNCSKFIVFL